MQSLKPRCAGCGTGNAIDAVFCQECGVGLNIDHLETIPLETDGNFVIKDSEDDSTTLFDEETMLYNDGTNIWVNPTFDYSLETKKKQPLHHLKEPELSNPPLPIDKRLDFRSMQIPDWEFGKVKKEFEKLQADPHNFPLISENATNIEFVPFPSQDKPDIATRRGPKPNKEFVIPPQKPEPTQISMYNDSTMNPSSGINRKVPLREVPSRLAFASSPKWFLGLWITFLPLIVILLYT